MAEFDEINQIYKPMAQPYETYFSEMGITKKQVDERIRFAEDFEDFLMLIVALVLTMKDFSEFSYSFVLQQVKLGYIAILQSIGVDDALTQAYAEQYAENFTRTTAEHLSESWYTSADRVKWNAENEAVTILGYKDFLTAKKRGFKHKRWVAFIDNKTRKTHEIINGAEIPIDDYFIVGEAQMLFPKDTFTEYSTGAEHPEEIVNCRCFVRYTR